jgi:hypothetical protein
MARTEPFEQHPDRYGRWFERHPHVVEGEVRALRSLMPRDGRDGVAEALPYEKKKDDGHSSYHRAHFYAVGEMERRMQAAGFMDRAVRQTLFHPLEEVRSDEPVRDESGEGAFVVIRGIRNASHTSWNRP